MRGMIVLDMAGVSMSTIWNIGIVKSVVSMGAHHTLVRRHAIVNRLIALNVQARRTSQS